MRQISRRQPLGAFGLIIVLVAVLIALFIPILPVQPPGLAAGSRFESPNPSHWFGTDSIGRDIFSRVLWGTRLSLWIGITSVVIGSIAGVAAGVASAWFGGTVDATLMRLTDVLMALPTIIFAITMMAALGQSATNVIIALAIVFFPAAARTYRAAVLTLQVTPFVEAARAVGASDLRILTQHILPNTTSIYIVFATTHIAYAIIVEGSLSFLGLGVPLDVPTWGGLLNTAVSAFLSGRPWVGIFPGLAVAATVLGFNLLGDSLRDVLDVRLRGTMS